MRFYIQALGMGSSLSSPSAFMFFDSARYLFNCGDCVQRVANEHKVRLSKLSDLFITSLSPNTIGSLPGMMLSLMDLNNIGRRRIHGPPGLCAFIESACTFVWNSQFDIIEYTNTNISHSFYKLTTNHVYQDENIKVLVMPYGPDPVDYIPLNNGKFLPVVSNSAAVYIIECKSPPAKFLKEKAIALGVSPGPMFGKLQKGETIIINGRTITKADVTEPPLPQTVVVIMDLPNTNYSQSLSEALKKYLSPEYELPLFVHFTEKDVLTSQSYLEMLLAFPATQNLVFNPQMTETLPIFKKSEELLIQLNKILPSAFPLPFNPQPQINQCLLETFQAVVPNFHVPNYLTKINLLPITSRGIDRSDELVPVNREEVLSKITEETELARSSSCNYSSLVDLSVEGSDPEILFLGTGSMKPGSHRNVSAVLLSDWGGSLLLDCGEGTYSQLMRAYGDELPSVLLDLKAILISHLHADHHLGIIKILAERAKLTTSPTLVIAPDLYKIYLGTCEKIMGSLNYSFQSVNNIDIPHLSVKAIAVDHRIEAYGFVITHKSNWKLVYSGDTRPSPPLIQEGYKATILIHEATLDDGLMDHAIQKFHSTLGEALQVASAMDAWKVVLTHFSQRYSKIPESTKVDAIYAFDLMRFKFSSCTPLVANMPMLLKRWEDDES